jgi:hypothetical protein
MYFIRAKCNFFRPYFIDGIELADIKFFDKNRVVLTVGRGWLEGTDGKDLNPFIVDKSPVKKRKVQFDKMYADGQPFYIKEQIIHRCEKVGYVLYVPYIPSEWSSVDESIVHATTRSFHRIHANNKQPFTVREYLRTEDIEDNVNFVEKVKKLWTLMTVSDSHLNEYTILQNRDQIIAEIKAFAV